MRRLVVWLEARHAANVARANPWPTTSGAITTKGAKMAQGEREGVASETEPISGTPGEVDGWEALRDVPGLTYRKFDYWCTEGYIRFAPRTFDRSGCVRAITDDEIRVVTLMSELVTLGLSPQTAEPLARKLALGITATFGGFKIRCAA